MTTFKQYASMSFVVWLTACGGKSSNEGNGRAKVETETNSAVQSVGTVGWHFGGFPQPFTTEDGQDAVTFTSGKMILKSIPVLDGFALSAENKVLTATLYVKKYALLRSTDGNEAVYDALSEEDKTSIGLYCKDLNVSLPDGAPAGTLGQEEFVVQWKSHFSQSQIEALGLLLLSANADFRCGLEFGMSYEGAAATNYMFLPFDPAPDFDPTKIHPADLYSGTERFAVARDEAIMLPEIREHKLEVFAEEWQKTELVEPSEIKTSIVALNGDDFSKDPEELAVGDACEFRLTDTLKVTNPAVSQTVTYSFAPFSERSFVLKSAGYTALPGVTSPEICKTLDFKLLSTNSFSYQATCAQTRDIVDVGSCGALLEFTNPDDPENSAFVKMSLGGLIYNQLDLTKPANAVNALPQAPTNPIRNSLITMTLFSDEQESELARSFDYWQAVSPASYESFFNNKITEMLYDSGSMFCDGAGAYAYLNTDKIYWCPGGGMVGDALTLPKSPYYLVYRATTGLHESLHANGNKHDIDDSGYAACSSAGTAYSAIVAVDTYDCTQDFCYGFKELAKEEFILELNYSLKNDARRFQGQCDVWAKKLGVTF